MTPGVGSGRTEAGVSDAKCKPWREGAHDHFRTSGPERSSSTTKKRTSLVPERLS